VTVLVNYQDLLEFPLDSTWISPGFTRIYQDFYKNLPGLPECYKAFTRIDSGAPAMLGGAPRRSAEHRRSAAEHLQLVNSGNDSGDLPESTRISPELLTGLTRFYQILPESPGLYQDSPVFHQKMIHQDFTRIHKDSPGSHQDFYQDFTRIYQDSPGFYQDITRCRCLPSADG